MQSGVIELVRFRGWSLTCDRDATERAHLNAEGLGAEACGCLYCLNYIAVRPTLFDTATRDLLKRLGIPSMRETRVSDLGRTGLRLYIVLYHFVGEIRGRPNRPNDKIQFRDRCYPLPPSFDKLPVVEISVTLDVPWIRPEAEPK
jgi:hypothetical protein